MRAWSCCYGKPDPKLQDGCIKEMCLLEVHLPPTVVFFATNALLVHHLRFTEDSISVTTFSSLFTQAGVQHFPIAHTSSSSVPLPKHSWEFPQCHTPLNGVHSSQKQSAPTQPPDPGHGIPAVLPSSTTFSSL